VTPRVERWRDGVAVHCDRECNNGGDQLKIRWPGEDGKPRNREENAEVKGHEVKTARDEVYIVAGSGRDVTAYGSARPPTARLTGSGNSQVPRLLNQSENQTSNGQRCAVIAS
jgi:hypothetical protein